MKQSRLSQVAAVASLALLLASCSAQHELSEEKPAAELPQEVFAFENPQHTTDSGALTVQVPADAAKIINEHYGELLVTSADLTTRQIEDFSLCAVDVKLTYAENAKETLTKPVLTVDEWLQSEKEDLFEEAAYEAFNVLGDSSSQLLDDVHQYTLDELQTVINKANLDSEKYLSAWKKITPDNYEPETKWRWLYEAMPLADLNESSLEKGLYYDTDYEHFTYVTACAASVTDTSFYDLALSLPVKRDDQAISDFASLDITLMKSGTIGISEADIAFLVRDTDGNWVSS